MGFLGLPGLSYMSNFVSEEEANSLISCIDQNEWSDALKRKVQQYGYRYSYTNRTVNSEDYIGTIPEIFGNVGKKLVENGYFTEMPEQIIVNNYEPGQGIALHVDNPEIFDDTVCSLSLVSAYNMVFENVETREKKEVALMPRSLLVMTGDARYKWKHGIVSRKSDKDPETNQRVPRGRRVSVTFRRMCLSTSIL
jgi:alkylated DNA repair dioxygenase AlkB